MLVRIIHFIVGAVLAGGGGFLVWIERARASSLFPPDATGAPWLLIAGLLGIAAGLVFLVTAVLPRPDRSARHAAEAARRDETLNAADAFYSERARAADRDWRSGDLPPVAPPAPRAAPDAAPAPRPALDLTVPASARLSAVKPVATSAPPDAAPFPSTATLAPIPRSSDPPPPAAAPPPRAPPPAPPPTLAPAATSFAAIRAALAEGRLAEADRLLTVEREKAQGLPLAELTGLAGDHAAAAGRTSNAKWLWRLALKRFGELNAMDSLAARAVSESLRLAD